MCFSGYGHKNEASTGLMRENERNSLVLLGLYGWWWSGAMKTKRAFT